MTRGSAAEEALSIDRPTIQATNDQRAFDGPLLHESSLARTRPTDRIPYLPMRYDTGRPSLVSRLRISQPRTTSLPCPAGLRARRPSPMMDL